MDVPQPVRPLAAGELFADVFRVEALLGRGGTAAVYRVRDERSGRKLALKQLLPPEDERRELVRSQFEREFHALAQLAHPRIIEVYDYGLAGGSAYYTMELLDGEDLHERGTLPWRKACALLSDVASSLAIVHSRGLVHRDITARNVRCTADDRAKLIDFGAMARIGVSHRLVGTPPFVPPEALQLQALDGRADLYGLGALAYVLLTGRYAYAAKSFNQLRDLWRTPPASPRQFQPELPEALSQLVLQLLALERGERPGSAAEVIERLSGIAGLQLEEVPQVGRAYLVMPTLVGREAELRQVRAALLSTRGTGQGATILIAGEPGSGRSRLLDACVLEAKLTGAVVLRRSAADDSQEPYALARVLCRQLLDALPGLALQTAQPRQVLLSHLLPELSVPGERRANAPERRHLQAALRDWVLALARARHVVIAVDDLGRVDEPSAAWIGALAHGAQRRMLTLLVTAPRTPAPSGALALMRELARTVELSPLSETHTEQLLRSLFGDADRLLPLAQCIHASSGGNPRAIMGMVEQLLSTGALRYEAGSWRLPLSLSAEELPSSEHEATLQRLASLSSDARTLLQALSLTNPAMLSLPAYARLTDHGDHGLTYRALDELVSAGFVALESDRYRVTRSDATDAARAQLDDARKRTLHGRIAGVLRDAPDLSSQLSIAQHLLLAGREREAIERLCPLDNDAFDPRLCGVFAQALPIAERLQLPARTQLQFRYKLAVFSGFEGRHDLFAVHAPPMLERMERDSGLLDYFELGSDLSHGERLAAAFARAQARFDALPPDQRGMPPAEAVDGLLGLYSASISMAAITINLEVVERLKSLAPFYGLRHRIEPMDQLVQAQRALQSGRSDVAATIGKAIVASFEHMSSEARNAPFMQPLRLSQVYAMGLRTALVGLPVTESLVADLEQQPGYRSHAWRIRMVYQLALGNPELARDCRRRAELLELQDGGQIYPGSTLRTELSVYLATDDLMGVKRLLERIEPFAAALPGWRATAAVARAHYRRLQGDLAGALEGLQPQIEAIAPGRHFEWGSIAETRLMLLRDLGRPDDAVALGFELLELCRRHELNADVGRFKRLMAEVLAHTGQPSLAREFAAACIEQRERAQVRGVMLALVYETGARVAIAARDEAELLRCAERCARELVPASNPSASAKYERLMREAAAAGMTVAGAPAAAVATPADAADAARTVYSRMLTCISPAERSEKGLQLLLEATGANTGHLFGLRSGQLRWLASGEPTEPSAALLRALESFLRERLDDDASDHRVGDRAAAALQSFLDDFGRELQPMLLVGKHDGEAVIAGVAALHYEEDERPQPREAMLQALSDALIAGDLVDPITCVA